MEPDYQAILDELKVKEITGDFATARQDVESALNYFGITAHLLNHRGLIKRMQHDWEGADNDYKTAMSLAKNSPIIHEIIINLADLNRIQSKLYDIPPLDEIIETTENPMIKARALDQKGQILVALRSYEEALQDYNQAFEMVSEDNTLQGLETLANLGVHYARAFILGNEKNLFSDDMIPRVQDYVFSSKMFANLLQNDIIYGNALVVEGRLNMILGNLENAEDNFAEAESLFNKNQYSRGLAFTALQQASLKLQQGDDFMPYLEVFNDGCVDGSLTNYDLDVHFNQIGELMRAVVKQDEQKQPIYSETLKTD